MGDLLSRPTYLALLRAVFFFSVFMLSSFSLFVQENLDGDELDLIFILLLLFFALILIHQIVYAFRVPYLSNNLFDTIWIFLEALALTTYTVAVCANFKDFFSSRTDSTQAIVSIILTTLYIFLLISRVYLYVKARKLQENRPLVSKMGGISILFGKSLWKGRLIGETQRLIIARGIFASLLLAGVVAFFYISIFTATIQELQYIPTQYTRFAGSEIPYPNLLTKPLWGVTFIQSTINSNDFVNLTAAIEVTPLWDNSSVKLQCDASTMMMSTYFCPSQKLPPDGDQYFFNHPEQNYNLYQPDLLITVNFSDLMVPPDTIIDIASNSVQVVVMMSNNTADALRLTRPTIIVPGVNMIGIVSMEIHQTFKNPGVATLGIFESMQQTLVGQVSYLYPDPSASPLIQRSANISTLRLSVARDSSTQWIVIRDIKNNSFVTGFSKVGGLWTFLSGVFAAIFGSSLMRVLFGIKPISVFGFAHRWERDTIGAAYRAKYPAIQEEMAQMGADAVEPVRPGLLCLIRDEIVDLGLIQGEKSNESNFQRTQDYEEIPLQPSANLSFAPVGQFIG